MGEPPRFLILGPLRVRQGDRDVALPRSPVLRSLLGALLAARDEPVAADQLMQLVWSGPVAAGSLHVGLSRLRRWLSASSAPARVEHDPSGYRLVLPPGTVDIDEFRELAARAAGVDDPGERAAAAGAAMRVCRGPLLADVSLSGDDPLLRRIRTEMRNAGLLAADAAVAAGRADEAVGWLTEMADREPFDEPVHAQLITALAAAGRPAEALTRYERLRRALGDELGVHPGETVQTAYLTVLAADGDEAEVGAARAGRPRPGLLPADIAEFTGRDKPLAEILGRVADAAAPTVVPIVGVTGRAGVGKTALAVRAAHLLRPSFPDGQLFVDLHGYGAQAADPTEVLGRFLRALGVDGASVPDTPEERAERYRSEVDGRRVLVVLDNAADEAQVRPLLPGSPTCAVLTTSRRPLTGLGGAPVRLDVMDLPTTLDLLAEFVGRDRLAAEPSAAEDIGALCGGLPLAVRIAGGRLARLPHRRLRWLAERLADDRRTLDELRHEDLEVRASLGWSYRALSPPVARLLGRLAALDAANVAAWAAGALMDGDPDEHLDALVESHLLDVTGRTYRLHDLVRAYGRERAAQDDDPADLDAALRRALTGWLTRARAAAAALGHRFARAEPGPESISMADPGAWFDDERAALVAAVRQAYTLGADHLCWQLASHLSGFFELRNLDDDWLQTHTIALAAAERAGDDRGAGLIRHALGELHANRDRYDEALLQLARAADLLAAAGDRLAEAHARRSLGVAQRMTGDTDAARSSLEACLAVFIEHGDRAGIAHAQHGLGAIHREQGRLDEAASSYRESLAYFEATDDRFTGSLVGCSLGVVWRLLGQLPAAQECFERSLELSRTIDNTPGKAYALGYLGDLRTDLGEHELARTLLDASRSLATRLGDQFAVALATRGLGRHHACMGDLDAARAAYAETLGIFTELDLPLWRGRTLEAIGDLEADADPPAARAAWTAALELFRGIGAPEAVAVEARLSPP